MADKTIILDSDDVQYYREVVAQMLDDGALPDKNMSLPSIVQVFHRTKDTPYLGSWLVIDSTTRVTKSHGLEPVWRRWVFIDDEQGYHICENVIGVYQHLARRLKQDQKDVSCAKYGHVAGKERYEQDDRYTLGLSGFLVASAPI